MKNHPLIIFHKTTAGIASHARYSATATTVTTITAAFGTLVYDHTTTSPAGVTDQGICYIYFGGTQTITAGTFTILWATPSGAAVTAIFNISV